LPENKEIRDFYLRHLQLKNRSPQQTLLPHRSSHPPKFPSKLAGNFTREEYKKAVKKILAYIREGDIYQANLAQHWQFSFPEKIKPFELFQALMEHNPAPFSSFLHLKDNQAILSCSPERFFQVRGQEIQTEPIKGTVARDPNPKIDRKNRNWLWQNEKNRAELTMIIDLERNDLGKICEAGSVKVPQTFRMDSFSSVHHLVSQITGTLRPEITPGQIFQAMFPGGSITGAPKLRAMEIIAEIEKVPRGVYTGTLGYLTPHGTMDWNIAIRTLTLHQNKASLYAGAGIVAESDPEKEYQETLAKVRPIFEVIENFQKQNQRGRTHEPTRGKTKSPQLQTPARSETIGSL
jgi:aminodeoxychorismate synthase component I